MLGIVLVQFIFSFLASAAFAIIINVPRRSLVACGLTGSVSWMLYWVIVEVFSGNAALGSLIGAVGVAAVSYLFSKILKMPVTIFNIPGIVPLVPGGLAYQAVRNIVIGNYEKGAYFTVQAVMIAGAIALGLVASEVFNQNIRSFREKENLWVLFVVNATKLKNR